MRHTFKKKYIINLIIKRFYSCSAPSRCFTPQLDQCRASLSVSEESRDQLRRDVLDTERRHSQTQDAAENYRRENTELRRNLSDVSKERDTLSQSNVQLRETLRSAETERIR